MTGSVQKKVKDENTIIDLTQSDDYESSDGSSSVSGLGNSPAYPEMETTVSERSLYPEVTMAKESAKYGDTSLSDDDYHIRSPSPIETVEISSSSDDDDDTSAFNSKESNEVQHKMNVKKNIDVVTLSDDDEISHVSDGSSCQNSPTNFGLDTTVNESSLYPEVAKAKAIECIEYVDVPSSNDHSNLVEQDVPGLISPVVDRLSGSPIIVNSDISDSSDHDNSNSDDTCMLKTIESNQQVPQENSTEACFPVTPATEPVLFVDRLGSDGVNEVGRNSPNPISLTPEVLAEFKRFISNNDPASLMSLLGQDYTDAVEVSPNTSVYLEPEAGESQINVDVCTITALSPAEKVVMFSSPEPESSASSATLTPPERSKSNSSMFSASTSSSSEGMGNKNRIVPLNERYDMFEVPTYPNFSCEYCSHRFIMKPTMLMHQALHCLKNPNMTPRAPASSNENTQVGCAKTPTSILTPTPQIKFQEKTNNQPSKSQVRSPKTRRRWSSRSSNAWRMHVKSKGILLLTPIGFYVPRIRIGYRTVSFCKYCKTLLTCSGLGNRYRHKSHCRRMRKRKIRPHVCSICRRRFISECNLGSHQNIEHKDKKRKCRKF